jgi:hypothetical protein
MAPRGVPRGGSYHIRTTGERVTLTFSLWRGESESQCAAGWTALGGDAVQAHYPRCLGEGPKPAPGCASFLPIRHRSRLGTETGSNAAGTVLFRGSESEVR